jgi:hypothetical protein
MNRHFVTLRLKCCAGKLLRGSLVGIFIQSGDPFLLRCTISHIHREAMLLQLRWRVRSFFVDNLSCPAIIGSDRRTSSLDPAFTV